MSSRYPVDILVPVITVELTAAGHFLDAALARRLRTVRSSRRSRKHSAASKGPSCKSRSPSSGIPGKKASSKQTGQRTAVVAVLNILGAAHQGGALGPGVFPKLLVSR